MTSPKLPVKVVEHLVSLYLKGEFGVVKDTLVGHSKDHDVSCLEWMLDDEKYTGDDFKVWLDATCESIGVDLSYLIEAGNQGNLGSGQYESSKIHSGSGEGQSELRH